VVYVYRRDDFGDEESAVFICRFAIGDFNNNDDDGILVRRNPFLHRQFP
jgi:hypothetical protein